MQVLNCPVCSAPMREASKNGVTIDTCTRCRGVWLDRGELEKLMEGLRPEIREYETHRRHDRDDDDDDHRHHHQHHGHHGYPHKKRSKLESFMDIFD
ncbi:MAG: zf-TFIIB domain-containing protein [Alphaproteobacteria bacterium]|nr:zf-TFIIB domain-containing protein [Alphaproteobacteria bacterium]